MFDQHLFYIFAVAQKLFFEVDKFEEILFENNVCNKNEKFLN